MSSRIQDEFYMSRALSLAKKAWGNTLPNPMVGAVIVKDGKIISEGYHEKDGSPHAEKNALAKINFNANNATIYVTLEPCSTIGRTGSCTNLIINSGIKRVVIGALDKNPQNSNKAKKILESHGIKVDIGILNQECEELNFLYNFNIQNQKTLIAIKVAISADWKISSEQGLKTIISGKESWQDVMNFRKLFPAIGIGFQTLMVDNPKLTSRINNTISCPKRLVFDRNLNTANLNLKYYNLFSDQYSSNSTVVCDLDCPQENFLKLQNLGVDIIQITTHRKEQKKFWSELKRKLYQKNLYALYVEGGKEIFSSLIKYNEYDYLFLYQSPNIIGKKGLPMLSECISLDISHYQKKSFGNDICHYGFKDTF